MMATRCFDDGNSLNSVPILFFSIFRCARFLAEQLLPVAYVGCPGFECYISDSLTYALMMKSKCFDDDFSSNFISVTSLSTHYALRCTQKLW